MLSFSVNHVPFDADAVQLHYAKLTKRRAMEEANAAAATSINSDFNAITDFNSFPPSMQTYSVEGII